MENWTDPFPPLAAPDVAGVAALVAKRFGGSAESIISRIENSVDIVDISSQYTGLTSTEGRVNLRRALSPFSNLPSANGSAWRNSPWFG